MDKSHEVTVWLLHVLRLKLHCSHLRYKVAVKCLNDESGKSGKK